MEFYFACERFPNLISWLTSLLLFNLHFYWWALRYHVSSICILKVEELSECSVQFLVFYYYLFQSQMSILFNLLSHTAKQNSPGQRFPNFFNKLLSLSTGPLAVIPYQEYNPVSCTAWQVFHKDFASLLQGFCHPQGSHSSQLASTGLGYRF